MLHHFRIRVTAGRQCDNVACDRRGTRVDRHLQVCETCQRTLAPVRELNWPGVALVASVGTVLVIGLVFLTHLYLQRKEVLRLAQARSSLESALRGATASDVDSIVRSVQAELQLTDEQKQRVVKESQGLISSLPRVLTPDLQQRLEPLVRRLYGDGRISPAEQIELDEFTRDQRLAPQAVQAFGGKITSRLDGSYRSLAQGRSLAELEKYEEAKAAFDRAIQMDPGNTLAWASLGAAHAVQGQSSEARSCYDKALSLDPENWLAHYNLGLLLARGGDRNSALEHFRGALGFLPKTANQERREIVDALLREPSLEDLRSDPRFVDLLSGSGVPETKP